MSPAERRLARDVAEWVPDLQRAYRCGSLDMVEPREITGQELRTIAAGVVKWLYDHMTESEEMA